MLVWSEAPAPNTIRPAPTPASGSVVIVAATKGRAQPQLATGAVPDGVKISDSTVVKTKAEGTDAQGMSIVGWFATGTAASPPQINCVSQL